MARTKKSKQKESFELMSSFGYSYVRSLGCGGCFIDDFAGKKDICKLLTCSGIIWTDPDGVGINTIHGYSCMVKAHS